MFIVITGIHNTHRQNENFSHIFCKIREGEIRCQERNRVMDLGVGFATHHGEKLEKIASHDVKWLPILISRLGND